MKTMKNKKPKAKALVLLSGGLDSRLVCKLLEEQLGKDNVEALFFVLPFGGGCCNDRFCVFKFAQAQGLKLHIIDCTKAAMFRKYMGIIRKPKFQRGTAMNPCIDCHIFMLKEARKLAKKTGASIIATGEVLGERPLSQHRQALELVGKEAGLKGRLLRPLSAKLLPETEAEKKGWITRERLLDIEGRQRKKQIALAKKYRISFPMPGGGCLLTEKEFSKRLKNFLDFKADINMDDIELLKVGRHFMQAKSAIIVGRNHEENMKMLALARKMKPKPAVLEVAGYMGPTTLVLKPLPAALRIAGRLTVRYSDAPKDRTVKVETRTGKAGKLRILKVKALPDAKIAKLRV